MPENAEVYIMSEIMNRIVCGFDMIGIEINDKSRYYHSGIKNFYDFELPIKLNRIYSRGKVIIFEFEKDVYIVSNLGYGKWLLEPHDHSGFVLTFEKDKKSQSLYFDDARHFGHINIYLSKKEFETKMKKTGMDILRALIDKNDKELEKVWIEAFSNKRKAKKEVARFLLDQDKFSGIGNYLRAEILYDAKISPFRTLESLSKEDVLTLYESTKKIILIAFESGGHTLSTYTDPLGAIGRYKPKVYKRIEDEHKNKVSRDLTSDGRAIYWVPNLQL